MAGVAIVSIGFPGWVYLIRFILQQKIRKAMGKARPGVVEVLLTQPNFDHADSAGGVST